MLDTKTSIMSATPPDKSRSMTGTYRLAKRTMDVLLSLAVLIALSPLLAITAILIRLTSPGPVIFRQRRMGMGGGEFTLIKFRTMEQAEDSSEESFDPGQTKRITRLGRMLRITKLDEVPQLWNVLRGEMSLVGPRPEVRAWTEVYPESWSKVLSVKPGITDPASILYRNEEELLAESDDPEKTYKEIILPHKLELYQEYVDNMSFSYDLKLIFTTLFAILFPGGFCAAAPGKGPAGRDGQRIKQ